MKTQFSVIFGDDETIVKQEQLVGIRRTPTNVISLTPEEARMVEGEIKTILYRIAAGRAQMSEEERQKLPRIETKAPKGKEEVME